MGVDAVLQDVGPRLRALRRGRGYTLAELADVTAISVSTLSRLESGQRKPTLELLLPLARAYGVALDELVDAPETGDPRVRLRPLQRHGMTMLPLTRRPGGLQAYKLLIPPGSGVPEQRSHEGYDWLYVLAGRLRLLLGEQDLTLLPGEVAEFDTHVPHWFGSADREPAEVLALFAHRANGCTSAPDRHTTSGHLPPGGRTPLTGAGLRPVRGTVPAQRSSAGRT